MWLNWISKKRRIHPLTPIPLHVAWITVKCAHVGLSEKLQDRKQEILSTYLWWGADSKEVKTCAEQCPSTGLESEVKPRGCRAAPQWCQTHLPFRADLKCSLNHTLNFYRYIKSLPRVFIMLHWSILLLFPCQENHFLL